MHLTISKKYLLLIIIFSESVYALDENIIIFGGHDSFPPFEWQDGHNKKGFIIDIENKISEIGGSKSDHELGSWPDMVKAISSGKIDVLAMYISEYRQDKFFSAHLSIL